MYVIEGKRKGCDWISALFQTKRAVRRFLDALPPERRVEQTVREIPFSAYPVYAIERFDADGHSLPFEYTDAAGVRAAVAAIPRDHVREAEDRAADERGDHDHTELTYMNMFRFGRAWRPGRLFAAKAGTDVMGCIDHQHVTWDFLEALAEHGWAGWA